MNNKVKGYLLGAVAAASYGTNPLFALPLYAKGFSPDSVLFFRYLFALPILAFMLKWRGHSFRISRADLVPLVILGLIFALSSLSLFLSYNYMDAGIASTILFVYPIMVAVIMAMFFHEKLTIQTMLCLLMAIGGIGLLYQNENGATLFTLLCHLYRSHQPNSPPRYGNSKGYILCSALRLVSVCWSHPYLRRATGTSI